jgi:NADH-quinone oxidoreductase subunit M
VFVALTSGVVPVSAYLFLRLSYTLFPESISQAAPIVVSVGVVNLLMGSLCASAQRTLPLLLAFLGLTEVGLIMIGIGSLSSSGLMGAVFQVFVMGLSLAGFGLGSGILMNRFGSQEFTGDRFGGTAIQQPAIAVVVGLIMASVLGLPGLSGFVGHALIVLGGYGSHPAAVLIVGGCFVLLVSTLFGMYRSVFFGKARSDRGDKENADLSIREKAYLLPLVGGLLSFGVYPKPLLDLIRPTVLTLLSLLK